MNKKELNQWLEAEMGSYPCKTALHMTDADTGEVLHSFHADEIVTSASTIKTPILLAVLDLVDGGLWDLQDAIELDPSEILPDSEVFEKENLRKSYTLWEYLYWMIVNSDNTATNKVLDIVGFDTVNRYCRQVLGLKGTVCQRKMLDFEAKEAGRDNLTTAADQCRVFELLYRGKAVSRAMTEVALDMLTRQRMHRSGVEIKSAFPSERRQPGIERSPVLGQRCVCCDRGRISSVGGMVRFLSDHRKIGTGHGNRPGQFSVCGPVYLVLQFSAGGILLPGRCLPQPAELCVPQDGMVVQCPGLFPLPRGHDVGGF